MTDGTLERLRAAVALPDLSGTPYEPIREIGRGGMGAVYLARDRRLEREVALKVIDAWETGGEARVLARLEHPGIVPVHDAGTLPDGRVFYVMKRVQGDRLDRLRDAQAALPERLRIFVRICEPVAFAHARGVVHRDLKPENIMVGPFGEVLVLDWGVAKTGEEQEAAVAGTPGYMAPEQELGQADARSDVYALGRILAFLLSDMRRVPRPLAAICARATAPRPEGRYPGALEMAAEVARFLDGEPVRAYREAPWERAARLARRHKALLALIGAYVAMRALLFFFARV